MTDTRHIKFVMLHKIIKYSITLISLFALHTAGHAADFKSAEIVFEVRMGSMKLGKGVDRLTLDGTQYTLVSQVIPKGLASFFLDKVERVSRGTVSDEGIKPDTFQESGNKKKGESFATFDWVNQTIELESKDGKQTLPLPESTIDHASLPYTFAFKNEESKSESLHMTDGRRLKEYNYERGETATLSTSLGDITTTHYKKVVSDANDRKFEFWLSHAHQMLPVKLRFVDKKGRVIESFVTQLLITQ